LTGSSDLVAELVRVARTGAELLRDAGVGCESPGVALRAYDQPGGAARVLPFGPVVARQMAVSRLSAASDDAAELAAGFGEDAALWVNVWAPDQAGRCARMAVRCAEQCRRLRELAEAIQEATDAPLCGRCGQAEAEAGGLCLRCAAGGAL
jgi:hypothetical protein